MKHSFSFGLACALVLLAGCGKKASEADLVAGLSDEKVQPASAAAAVPDGGGLLFVEPGNVQLCAYIVHIVAKVSWKVQDPTVSKVRVEVNQKGDAERKLFTVQGPQGEQMTGPWVTKGTQFHLMDDATNKELATFEVTNKRCN